MIDSSQGAGPVLVVEKAVLEVEAGVAKGFDDIEDFASNSVAANKKQHSSVNAYVKVRSLISKCRLQPSERA